MPAEDLFSEPAGGQQPELGFGGSSDVVFPDIPEGQYLDQWGQLQHKGGTYGLQPHGAQYQYREDLGGLGRGMQRFAQEAYNRLNTGQDSAAQRQMQMGLGQAQRAMQQAAVARGSNPLAQRAAVYGGGQMAQEGVNQSALLRAQEMQAGRRDVLGAMQARAGVEAGLQTREQAFKDEQERLRMQRQTVMHAMHGDDEDMSGAIMQGIGTGMTAGATAIGKSDERAKQNAYEMGRQDQDNLMRKVGQGDEGDGANLAAAFKGIGGALKAVGGPGPGESPFAQLARTGRVDPRETRPDPLSVDRGNTRQQVRGELAAMHQNERGGNVPWSGERFDPTRPMHEQPGSVLDRTARSMDLHGFEYKPEHAGQPGAPAGQRAGVMAQDLERDPLARRVVVPYGDGMRGIDQVQAMGLSLGLHGRTAERLDELDRRVGGGR